MILGETTIYELYDMVGTALCWSEFNIHADFVYLLEDGRYLIAKCYYWLDADEETMDFTIDEI